MTINVKGNSIRITLSANENNIDVLLPDGYSYEQILLTAIVNINYINPNCAASVASLYTYPPVNNKSPSLFHILKRDSTAEASLVITITKFGQIPSTDYFKTTFEPILVTADDGKEYNVIPSDQFK